MVWFRSDVIGEMGYGIFGVIGEMRNGVVYIFLGKIIGLFGSIFDTYSAKQLILLKKFVGFEMAFLG